jgi:hypothetical protein
MVPKTSKERLILLASIRVSPLLFVLFVFSLPARSTRHNRPSRLIYPFHWKKDSSNYNMSKPEAPESHLYRVTWGSSGSWVSEERVIVISECERLEFSFMLWLRTCLFLQPVNLLFSKSLIIKILPLITNLLPELLLNLRCLRTQP